MIVEKNIFSKILTDVVILEKILGFYDMIYIIFYEMLPISYINLTIKTQLTLLIQVLIYLNDRFSMFIIPQINFILFNYAYIMYRMVKL